MLTDKRLVDKYNESGPRYTSYPPATFFNEYFGEKEYLDAVENQTQKDQKIYPYIFTFRFALRFVIFADVQLKRVFLDLFLKDTSMR